MPSTDYFVRPSVRVTVTLAPSSFFSKLTFFSLTGWLVSQELVYGGWFVVLFVDQNAKAFILRAFDFLMQMHALSLSDVHKPLTYLFGGRGVQRISKLVWR